MKTLADSGYFVGLFNPRDEHHATCLAFSKQHVGVLVTTWAVFTEVCYLLPAQRLKAFFAWADNMQAAGHLVIDNPPRGAVAALWALMHKYETLPMDFCDASLVYLAQQLGIARIATVDRRDFTVYRLPGKKRFDHVLYEQV